MDFVFRTDASLSIGSGHLMRCLTLANALRERGAKCTFICREHPGHRNDLVLADGFMLRSLPFSESYEPASESPPHARWLGCSWMEDAGQTIAVLDPERPDWLIVDHYALDERWERALRPFARRLMAIDDLADRYHDADLLLDQNLGVRESDYLSLVPPGCDVLAGTGYALLRPEFASIREKSLRHRDQSRCRKLLIAMGGVDFDNATGKVLDALSATCLPPDCRIVIALGSKAPGLEALREQAAACTWPCELRLDVDNMAELLCDCDLAIGAAGTSALERCCLGLPSILVVLAVNQRGVANALEATGGALSIGTPDQIGAELAGAICAVSQTDVLARMSQSAAGVCDGKGLARVLERLCGPIACNTGGCVVRPMLETDLEQVLRWRNHPQVRRYMYTRHEISMVEHRAWFERSATDPNRHLLIAEFEGNPQGFVHFEGTGQDLVAQWGFYVAPGAPRGSGRRLCSAALRHAFGPLGLHKVCGQVCETNERSIALHCALGFVEEERIPEAFFDGERYQGVLCFGLHATEWQQHQEDPP